MKLFRVYTQNKNLEQTKEVLNNAFDGYTLIQGAGYWKGTSEKSLIIEIVTIDDALVYAVAERIKKDNHQKTILITSMDVSADFL